MEPNQAKAADSMADVAFAHCAAGTKLNSVEHTPDRRFWRAVHDGGKLKWRTLKSTPGITAGTQADYEPGTEMAMEPDRGGKLPLVHNERLYLVWFNRQIRFSLDSELPGGKISLV
jgi:hypothetical protein